MTFILCSPIAALTWVLIATCHHVWVILLSRCFNSLIISYHNLSTQLLRIISGFLFGLFQANGKVYNAEISHPDVRFEQKLTLNAKCDLQGKHWHRHQQLVHAGLPLHLRLQLLHRKLANSRLAPDFALRPSWHLLLLCSQLSLLAG